MDLGNFKVKLEAHVIARYKDYHHFLILMDGKFCDVLIAEIDD
ncbi:hypothetical protein [Bacillus sp. T33-2]|nr:hypothetical protein [Bacillus sp. T33-2]